MAWKIEYDGVPLFVHIAAGVFLGLLTAALVIWRVAVWQLELVGQEAKAVIESRAAAASAEIRRSREIQQQQEVARRAQAASDQRAQEDAKRQALDEVERRDAAWERFYRKPASCDESRGGEWSVGCANEFMRAKKRFTELYEAGKL